MYSLEERLLAVKTYYEMGKNAKATVRRLGYPDESNISRWVKEYERVKTFTSIGCATASIQMPKSKQQ